MGILRSVIQSLVRTMFYAGQHVAFHHSVGSKFIGGHDTWSIPMSFQKLSHKAFGGLGIAAALQQPIQYEAILIDSLPKPVFLAANGDDDLIEGPFAAEPTSGSPPDVYRIVSAGFLRPEQRTQRIDPLA